MKIRSKSTNKNYLILSAIFTLSIATVFGVGIYTANTTNALSYSTSEDVSFTFKPTLSIGLSTNSLTIDNLVPGTTSDSNTVTVTVSSNTPYGYVLSAGVGSTVSTDPYYNTSDLVHDNSTTQVPTTNKFSSIATSASLPTLDADNTWGYSTSTDGGTSWSTYSGLSNTTTKPLLDISDPATPSTMDFKIAARSATTQASGTYNNVITFYAVGKPEPVFYMQDTATIKAELQNVGDELQAIDIRDGKKYWVAKQADGKIWMTQNLDLCIGCGETSALTTENTDFHRIGTGAYSNGYGYININGEYKMGWHPSSTAYTSNTTLNNGVVSPAFATGTDGCTKPYSAEGGDKYIYTSNSAENDIIYNSLSECAVDHTMDDCTHYHIGNYYNWSAAIASNNSSSIKTQFSVASNSICPAGWSLPIGRASQTVSSSTYEFGELIKTSGIASNPTGSHHFNENGFNNIRISPLYFIRGGSIRGNSGSYGYSGEYWSSTVSDDSYAHRMHFRNNYIEASGLDSRDQGHTVRCIMR